MGGGSGAPPAHTTPISCWLVPPEKPKAELSALVQKLASENGLPAFDVHITIIGDVLGHRSTESTNTYLKLATEDLRAVALDVPGSEVLS